MGLDYSYTQPSSSEEGDLTYLFEAEAAAFASQGGSAAPVEYPPQPEADEGIPTACYCGDLPVIETAYTRKDPGRRYFSCANRDDGDCHIWKWWDVAVVEEIREMQAQQRLLKEQFFESDQKIARLEKVVVGLSKKKPVAKTVFKMGVCLLVMVIAVLVMWWRSFGGFKPQ